MGNPLRNAEIWGIRKRQRISPFRGDRVDKRLYAISIGLLLFSIPLKQPLILVSAIVMLLTLLLIDVWTHYSLYNVQYQRKLSETKALFGEKITLSISLVNAKILPLPFLEVDDTLPAALPLDGHKTRRVLQSNFTLLEALFSLRWYERVTRQYTLHCVTRGVHPIGPVRLRSSDAFGFLTQEMNIEEPQYLLVYPLVVPLTSFHLPARRPFGEKRVRRKLLEDPTRLAGVRDYVYGDNMRRIDWKATAREQKLQSKIYESSTSYTLSIFLNASMQLDTHYGINPEFQELGICVAASVADWGISEGYSVGLYANTAMHMPEQDIYQATSEANLQQTLAAEHQRRRIRLPASSNEAQRQRIMETLARINTSFGTTLEEVIQSERSHIVTGATIVVITSVLSERLTEQLSGMQRGGHAVTILFVGDSPVPPRVGGIPLYPIGGVSTWEKLQRASTNPQENTESPGLRL